MSAAMRRWKPSPRRSRSFSASTPGVLGNTPAASAARPDRPGDVAAAEDVGFSVPLWCDWKAPTSNRLEPFRGSPDPSAHHADGDDLADAARKVTAVGVGA